MGKLPMPKPEKIAIADLVPYPQYGRDRSERRLKQLKRTWVPAAIGIFHVSRRTDGSKVVMEGNHRLTVAQALGYPSEVWCLVHNNLTYEEEATLYRILNDMLPPKAIDLFRAEVESGNADALALNAAVADAGFNLGVAPGDRRDRAVNCIQALKGVQRMHGTAHVSYTLAVLHRTFGGDPAGVRDHTVAAFSTILQERHLDVERLGQKAGGLGFAVLKGMANSVRQQQGGSQADALVRVLTQEYNRGLPRNERIEVRRAGSARMLRRQGQTREAIWNQRIDESVGRPD